MRLMQSFLMFFYILDQCYDQCQENDLGGFLGSISPELWEDGRPIDKAVYNDWKEKNDVQTLNSQNIIKTTYDFLQYYESKFGYSFTKTKKVLGNLVGDEFIKKAQEKTDKMYQKYSYTD